ncbi:MAG TPA: 50S ribosomal protein L1 [Sedimentisphaerales bacterium]|nr:50S ribosomal protein L1 [Sedimentisphaerales bacterium]
MRFRSKRYKKESQDVSRESVSLAEAVEKVKSFKTAKFDQTIECVMHLGIDPKQADQLVRGSLSLPHGIGKQKKVIAFCEDTDVEAARKAGAVEAGCDALVKKISDGWMDFDVAVASPKVMSKVGKLGRILGPQGKMPSPKNGTVTSDIVTAVSEFAAGKVEFKNDAGGNVHVVVGKQSFDTQKLVDNIEAFVSHLRRIKPAATKGTYIRKMSLSATMSPGVTVSI